MSKDDNERKRRQVRATRACAVMAVVFAMTGVTALRAEVTDIRSTVEADAQEFVDRGPESTDRSTESFPGTSLVLPITAFAGLGNFTGLSEEEYGCRGIADFDDPTLTNEPNPAELGLEADTFSRDPSISYEVHAAVNERRDVVLSQADLGVTGDGAENLVTSSVFVEGAILVWTDDPQRDLTGARGDFDFKIRQASTNGAAGEVVFEVELKVEGLPDGDIRATHTSILDVVRGGPELLLSEEDPLTATLVAQLEEAGRMHLVIVPPQEILYVYSATAGGPFVLEADTRCRSTNLAGGTGVAVAFGRPFRDLAGVAEPLLSAFSGASLRRAVNRAIRTAEPAAETAPPLPFCGAFGLELPLLALLGIGTLWRHDR